MVDWFEMIEDVGCCGELGVDVGEGMMVGFVGVLW